jgi:putative transposase
MPFLTPRINENQWRMAHLFFIAGWPLRALGKRYNLAYWWVGRLVREWVERAIALGYVQQIPQEGPIPASSEQKPEFQLRRQVPARPMPIAVDPTVPAPSLPNTPWTRRPSRRSDSEVMAALGKLRQGMSVEEICETVGITRRTFYAWKGKFGNIGGSELAELHSLREENRILRRWSAALTLLLSQRAE